MFYTTRINKIKQDTALKNFWKDNERFADLFNAALFNGKRILRPEDLKEVDTDVSSLLRFNGHAETLQKVFDVVKKTAYGIEFIIWGLENQSKVHYAMPLRHMIGDAFSYLKEYNEIAAKNKKDKTFSSSDEFLSNFKKTDRLHPVISLCVYYGENTWDGPFCLKDMLEIPEELAELVADYKMNLLQIRKSDSLDFHNPDVATVFELSRAIYDKNYDEIRGIYQNQKISAELGIVIGAITGSQKLINHALESEEEGGEFSMCNALEEMIEEGAQRGRSEGRIEGAIATYKKCHIEKAETLKNIMEDFSLPEEEAKNWMERYW